MLLSVSIVAVSFASLLIASSHGEISFLVALHVLLCCIVDRLVKASDRVAICVTACH